MKRPENAVTSADATLASLEEDKWLGKYKLLCQYLTETKWDDGAPREPSAISVSCSDGVLLVALNDKDLKQSMYTSAQTLQEALKLMEEALASNRGSWRPWKTGKRK